MYVLQRHKTMSNPTIKLGKTTEGKLVVNSNGKLCLGCCDMTGQCDGYANSVCPACYQWNIPESVTVDLSGLTLASDIQYWLDGNNAAPGGTVNWCNHSWDGMRKFDFSSIDGSYTVPLQPHQGYSSYICGGSVDIPFTGSVADYYAIMQEPYDDVCNCVPGDLMRSCAFTAIRVSVGVAYAERQAPYENYRITVTISIIGDGECEGNYYNYYYSLPTGYTVFRGYKDYPAKPEENRAGINADSIANTKDMPYVCEVYGSPCPLVRFVPAWGGSANVTASETLYQFPVYIESFGPMDFYQHPTYGWQLSARLFLNVESLPHGTTMRIKYEVAYDDGVYAGEVCYSTYYGTSYGYYLPLPLSVGQYPGFVTMEVLSIECTAASNVFWDTEADEASSIITGTFYG